MPHLFDPLQIKSVLLKNRIVVSPMCQYSAVDGFANDWHLVHLGSRAVGGAALVFVEATAVAADGRISPGDLGIWKDEQIDGLKRITNFITQQDAVPGIQLAHAGRKAGFPVPWLGTEKLAPETGGWQAVAPSSIAFNEKYPLPHELSILEIEQLVQDFALAAKRSYAAGFQVIEIHAAHGYLLHEFLSPLSNFRNDDYGSSFENRIKILLDCISAIQNYWPNNLPIFVRISATEWLENGWTIDDSIALSKILKVNGVDLVDCSSGGNASNAKIALTPGYQVPLAKQVKAAAGILTGAVGLITNAHQAEEILENNEADLIFMARELLRDPYFPLKAAKELQANIHWPNQYLRANR